MLSTKEIKNSVLSRELENLHPITLNTLACLRTFLECTGSSTSVETKQRSPGFKGDDSHIVFSKNFVNLQIGGSKVLVKTDTLNVLSESPNEKSLSIAVRILDCFVSGLFVLYPKIAEREWDWQPSLLLFYTWCVERRWVKELKYHLCSFFCRIMEQEQPESIGSIHKPGTFLIGPVFLRICQKTTKKDGKAWIFLNTVINGFKKGFPLVDSEVVLTSAQTHKARLSKVEETPVYLLDEVRRTGFEIFRTEKRKRISGKGPISETFVTPGIQTTGLSVYDAPSINSCVESTRASGGPVGWLVMSEVSDSLIEYDICDLLSNPRPLSEMKGIFDFDERHPSENTLYRMTVWEPQLVSMRYDPKLGLHEVRARFIYAEIAKLYRPDLGGSDELFREDQTLVKFILEPLKVRPITAMGMGHNALYSELQVQLWDALQRKGQFCLTGRPVEVEDINRLVVQTQVLCPDWFLGDGHPLIVSGDYSGATDSCHLDLSKCLAKVCSDDPFVQDLLDFNLGEQVIDYSRSGLEEYPEAFKMTNGQLMGSRFSFPFLCAFNIAIYRYCLEALLSNGTEKIPIHKLPVLVNGDDILFMATPELVELWEKVIRDAGLEKSIGKNYVSSDFCTVNSCLFRRISRSDYFEVVNYVNLGLISGVQKTPFGNQTHQSQTQRAEKLVGSFSDVKYLPESYQKAFEEQIRLHRPEIRKSFLSGEDLGFHPTLDTGGFPSTNEMLNYLAWRKRFGDVRIPAIAKRECADDKIFNTHLVLLGEEDGKDISHYKRSLGKRLAAFEERVPWEERANVVEGEDGGSFFVTNYYDNDFSRPLSLRYKYAHTKITEFFIKREEEEIQKRWAREHGPRSEDGVQDFAVMYLNQRETSMDVELEEFITWHKTRRDDHLALRFIQEHPYGKIWRSGELKKLERHGDRFLYVIVRWWYTQQTVDDGFRSRFGFTWEEEEEQEESEEDESSIGTDDESDSDF